MSLTSKRILIIAGLILLLLLAGVVVLPARAQTYADLHGFTAGVGDPTNAHSGRLPSEQRLYRHIKYLE